MKINYREAQLMMVKEKIKEQLYCLDNTPNPEAAFNIVRRIEQLEEEKLNYEEPDEAFSVLEALSDCINHEEGNVY